MTKKRPVCLIILDGWGVSNQKEGNAIYLANTPNMDSYTRIYPNTTLEASGEAVGLPEGQMGNSEVGHLNIGAGRIVYQEFTRISKAIKSGEFFENKVLLEAVNNVKKNRTSLHIMGLVSDGGVHSHLDHAKALVDLALKNDVKDFFVHAFLDGRDVPPRSAIPYLEDLEDYLKARGIGEISTISGRYYAMDRDNRWDRTKKCYDALVYRKGERFNSPREVLEESYSKGIDDEFVVPSILNTRYEEKARVKTGDSVIFFNFRPDRARQLTRAFISEDFTEFDRGTEPPEVYFVCMTQYDKRFEAPVAFPPHKIVNTLGEVISNSGMRQLRIAETEKYAHVTFFFNGGVEKPFEGEDRILVPSPKVATYNLKPEMSAYEVTERVIEKIDENIYDVIILNYANPDMVGHTGFLDAAIKAIEVVDSCVGVVIRKLLSVGGLGIITADHGNAELMKIPGSDKVVTSHSTSPVPFIICDEKIRIRRSKLENEKSRQNSSMQNNDYSHSNNYDKSYGSSCDCGFKLCDIAPTVLDILGIEKPDEMTGVSLIEKDGIS
ncbi:MAG: 2,3-bisphosphoglycerate-independent phosphoglycerate mutase [Actinobacteria bacterium]|nr:2,3-bisphosphoglycerate-independent phosphoglycerate mutase [Actinomycetota bacterium]